MNNKIKLFFFLLAVTVVVALAAPVWATDWNDCDHPRFLEKGCGYEGEDGDDGHDGADGVDGVDGKDGRDGVDGKDGRDGVDGKDGRDGVDGRDGRDGVDGVVPTEWIVETRHWFKVAREAAAASAAMQVYLPQDRVSRMTLGVSRVEGTTGIGIGYAYMMDNERNSALTVAVGRSGSETAIKGSFGFEFGGARRMEIPAIAIVPAAPPEPEPIPTDMLLIPKSEYSELTLMAQNSEEVEEHIEQTEYRYAQQQSLLEELQAEHANDEVEIERLKLEAAAIRAKQDEVLAQREAVRQRILDKRKDDEKGTD